MISGSRRNWTSTRTPMWEVDMVNFWRAGGSFEVREVGTVEERAVVESFAREHGLEMVARGKTMILTTKD